MLTPSFTVDYKEAKIMGKITQALRDKVQAGLLAGAVLVENEAKKVAPKHVGSFIKHTGVTLEGNTYKIKVYVLIRDAPDAAAWEYGSGLHRTRTPASKYSIDAKNAPDLVFFWEREQKWFVGPHVNHPGIVARPYLHPALFDNFAKIKRLLVGK